MRTNEAEVLWSMAPQTTESAQVGLEDFLGRPNWHRQALCRGETQLYFTGTIESLEQARAICAGCPVRQDCIEAALADREMRGVWAGTTAAERRELRRRRVAWAYRR